MFKKCPNIPIVFDIVINWCTYFSKNKIASWGLSCTYQHLSLKVVLFKQIQAVDNKPEIGLTDGFHRDKPNIRNLNISSKQRITYFQAIVSIFYRLTHAGIDSHTNFSHFQSPLIASLPLVYLTGHHCLCLSVLHVSLQKRVSFFCFMSGFPLDLLCTPIRFVTQLQWMGLRERQHRGRGAEEGMEEKKGRKKDWRG